MKDLYYSLDNIIARKEIKNHIYEFIVSNNLLNVFKNIEQTLGVTFYFNDLTFSESKIPKISFEFNKLDLKFDQHTTMEIPRFMVHILVSSRVECLNDFKEDILNNHAGYTINCTAREIPLSHVILQYIHPHAPRITSYITLKEDKTIKMFLNDSFTNLRYCTGSSNVIFTVLRFIKAIITNNPTMIVVSMHSLKAFFSTYSNINPYLLASHYKEGLSIIRIFGTRQNSNVHVKDIIMSLDVKDMLKITPCGFTYNIDKEKLTEKILSNFSQLDKIINEGVNAFDIDYQTLITRDVNTPLFDDKEFDVKITFGEYDKKYIRNVLTYNVILSEVFRRLNTILENSYKKANMKLADMYRKKNPDNIISMFNLV